MSDWANSAWADASFSLTSFNAGASSFGPMKPYGAEGKAPVNLLTSGKSSIPVIGFTAMLLPRNCSGSTRTRIHSRR